MLRGLFKGQWLILLTILPVFLMASVVFAEVPVPQALIKDSSDRMQQALKDHKQTIEKNPSFVYGLVDDSGCRCRRKSIRPSTTVDNLASLSQSGPPQLLKVGVATCSSE